MKAIGQAADELEAMAEEALTSIGDWQGRQIRYEVAAVAVVSPIHRAVEGACFNVALNDEELFLKVRYPDMTAFFDDGAVASSCRGAAQVGVAPALRYAEPDRGIFVFDRLGDGWTWGTVDRFADPVVLESVVTAKKRIHDLPAFDRTESVFDVIERYWAMVQTEQVTVPNDVPSILEMVRQHGEAIAASGIDVRPCHGDGVASNIMIGPQAAVRLVDFDMGANCDPYYDIGSLMVEFFQFDDDARQVLEIYDGSFDEARYNRCRLYGIADDLMWALWGFICFELSPRKGVEFTKYAEWRLLRCRWHLGHPARERWLARV